MKKFEKALSNVNHDGKTLIYTSLVAHLLDQYNWGLLSFEEISTAASNILQDLREASGSNPDFSISTKADIIENWEEIILDLLEKEVEE